MVPGGHVWHMRGFKRGVCAAGESQMTKLAHERIVLIINYRLINISKSILNNHNYLLLQEQSQLAIISD